MPGAIPTARAVAAAPPVSGLAFEDESPTSSAIQQSGAITCKVTVETTTSTWITDVYYRVSNTGSPDSSFSSWLQISTTTYDTFFSASKLRFAITFPTTSFAFLAGSNNYIQWKADNATTLSDTSSKYGIVIATNDAPTITITQPDPKTGIASTMPQIEAILSDTVGGVDPASMVVTIAHAGSTIYTKRSLTSPAIFTASTNKLAFAYDGPPLSDGTLYTLSINAADTFGVAATPKTETFTVKGGAIADLVPYPSPFDPARGPIKINYTLSKRSDVTINVYNMGRKLVKNVIDNQSRNAGTCEDAWNGTNYAGDTMANGVYFCEVIAKDSDGEHRKYTSFAIFGK